MLNKTKRTQESCKQKGSHREEILKHISICRLKSGARAMLENRMKFIADHKVNVSRINYILVCRLRLHLL